MQGRSSQKCLLSEEGRVDREEREEQEVENEGGEPPGRNCVCVGWGCVREC